MQHRTYTQEKVNVTVDIFQIMWDEDHLPNLDTSL